eukprot:Skav228000  [mRNA]  locus=scaffold390:386221:390830:- [translate_table: standard]
MENKRRKVALDDGNPPSMAPTVKLYVSLPSGRSGSVELSLNDTVADLKVAAQQSLGQWFLKLAGPDGRLLNPAESLQQATLQDGDNISAVAQQPKIAATQAAFALWCVGSFPIVTWGSLHSGGNSTEVRDQLRNVQHIHSTGHAFAAILAHGGVVTWGLPDFGGDSSGVKNKLKNVEQIHATQSAFAAVLKDGTVVTWGHPKNGGDSSRVRYQLRNVQEIHATCRAFAATVADGHVVTWGTSGEGRDDYGRVRDQLRNVQHIRSTGDAFAAILADGSVVTWGHPDFGGDSSQIRDQLRDVQYVYATRHAFAAIVADGSVVTWGHPNFGGDSSGVRDQLRNVQQIYGSHSFVADCLHEMRYAGIPCWNWLSYVLAIWVFVLGHFTTCPRTAVDKIRTCKALARKTRPRR